METTDASSEQAHDEHGHEEHEHRSGWPLVAAIGAASLYFGLGLALVGLDLVPLPIPAVLIVAGLLGMVAGLLGWTYEAFLADYWMEGREGRANIYTGGMILFLASDVSTFAAAFVYYLFVRVGSWPPSELPEILGSLVLINTALLLASSVTLHYGHKALEDGNRKLFLGGLGATVGLGVLFVGGQIYEYYELIVHDGFSISSGIFGSAFYGLTGLHGLHVTLGVVMLGIVFGRALQGQYTAERDTSVTTASLYWHFVDGVWVVLVAVLYVGAEFGA